MGQTEINQYFLGLVALIIIPIILSPIYYFFLFRMRKVMLARIKKLMSKNIDPNNIEFKDEPVLKEIPAPSELQFLKFNANSLLAEANTTRKKTLSIIRGKYQKRLIFEVPFLILYLIIVQAVSDRSNYFYEIIREFAVLNDYPFEANMIQMNNLILLVIEPVNYFLFATKILIVWLLLKFIGAYYQYSAYINKFINSAKPIWKFISYLFVSRWGLPLYIVLILSGVWMLICSVIFLNFLPENLTSELDYAVNRFTNYFFLFISVVVMHVVTVFLLKIRGRSQSNRKLLILRVFGQHGLSQNLFSKLGSYWQMFGSYFTVIDDSFYQLYWKKKFNSNIGVYIFFSIILFASFGAIGNNFEEEIGVTKTNFIVFLCAISLIIPLIIIYYYNSIKIRQDVISSEERLKVILHNTLHNPIRMDGSFKEVPVLCYNDTWRMAVDRLSKVADIIAMDLRGYSETNKGCEYEVNFLFDHVQINKILFLTDSESIDIIEELLVKQWKMLLETSNNLKVKRPEVALYITAGQKDTEKETQGILDVLLYYAIKNDG